MFTLGGSWSGGVGGKDGELWTSDSNSWTLLPEVEAEGAFVTADVQGIEKGEYVLSDTFCTKDSDTVFVLLSNHMWLFTAPNTDKIFHAGPSTTAHWIDTTGNGGVTESVTRGDLDQMCGNAAM